MLSASFSKTHPCFHCGVNYVNNIWQCASLWRNLSLLKVHLCLYEREREREREIYVLFNDALNTFYLDIWLRTILIMRKETRCRHIGYSYRLTARVLLYAPSHRQDNTYHGLCYTSRGALAGTRNSSMGPPHEGSIRRPTVPWANALHLSYVPLPACTKSLELICVIKIQS